MLDKNYLYPHYVDKYHIYHILSLSQFFALSLSLSEINPFQNRYTPARWQCGKHIWETYYIRCGYLICILRRITSSYNSISFAMLADDPSSTKSIFILSSFVWMSFRKWHLLHWVLLLRNPESDFKFDTAVLKILSIIPAIFLIY